MSKRAVPSAPVVCVATTVLEAFVSSNVAPESIAPLSALFLLTRIAPYGCSNSMRTSFNLAGRPYCGMMTFWISASGIPIKKAASSSCEETDCAAIEKVL